MVAFRGASRNQAAATHSNNVLRFLYCAEPAVQHVDPANEHHDTRGLLSGAADYTVGHPAIPVRSPLRETRSMIL